MAVSVGVHAPIWPCHPDTVECQFGHPFLLYKGGWAGSQRVDGHLWHACKMCKPTTFFFGVVKCRGDDPYLICYAISAEQYDFWMNNRDELDTLEILHRLGYYPRWRPRP